MAKSKTEQTFCAEKLKVIADSTRLAILQTLMAGPRHVGEINEEIDIDQSLLSHHLRVLRDAGFVVSERDGKAVLYRLAPEVKIAAEQNGIELDCCKLSFS